MSTSNVDRHGDIVDQDTWMLEYFETNPAFFLNHRSNEFPIGKWVKIWLEADPDNPDKQRLVGTAEFRVEFEDAARAWAHVVAGDMNMVSVGFIPHRVEYDEMTDKFILYDNELMETSLVGIGSNRQALVKGEDDDETTEKVEEVRKSLITHSEVLDEISKADTTKRVSNRLKAQGHLHKAIRLMAK
jgi:HK97 family phage prohead protease